MNEASFIRVGLIAREELNVPSNALIAKAPNNRPFKTHTIGRQIDDETVEIISDVVEFQHFKGPDFDIWLGYSTAVNILAFFIEGETQ